MSPVRLTHLRKYSNYVFDVSVAFLVPAFNIFFKIIGCYSTSKCLNVLLMSSNKLL